MHNALGNLFAFFFTKKLKDNFEKKFKVFL
jgi:hypothetical protein